MPLAETATAMARAFPMIRAGGVAASVALILFASALSASPGRPTRLQIAALVGAIVFEAIAIRLAYGPLCAALGVASSVSAGTGLWWARSLPLNGVWAADGIMKIAFGAAMLGVGG